VQHDVPGTRPYEDLHSVVPGELRYYLYAVLPAKVDVEDGDAGRVLAARSIASLQFVAVPTTMMCGDSFSRSRSRPHNTVR
jgi:hypothetical protein